IASRCTTSSRSMVGSGSLRTLCEPHSATPVRPGRRGDAVGTPRGTPARIRCSLRNSRAGAGTRFCFQSHASAVLFDRNPRRHGEAQLPGTCAVVSSHRLRQEFYGLPADPKLQHERLLKEAVHELGHTLNLSHCEDYQCAMAPSHGVEWIDLKTSRFCRGCCDLAPTRSSLNASR